jgi:hypothetical protein
MNPGCRVMGLFLVGLALFQSLSVAVDAWQAQLWPALASEWVRLALLPVALWVYVRYFSIWGSCQCGDDDDVR